MYTPIPATKRSNRNARIVSSRSGNRRVTRTARRDDGALRFELTTNVHGRSVLSIEDGNNPWYPTFVLSGREARTLKRLLDKHFSQEASDVGAF